jgi:hypothetical protein
MPTTPTNRILNNGVEDGDAAAEERTGSADVYRFRQWNSPSPMASDAVCKSAITPDDRVLAFDTQVVVASQAVLTPHATACEPPKPHTLAFSHVSNLRAYCRYDPGNLVSSNKWILRIAPLLLPH